MLRDRLKAQRVKSKYMDYILFKHNTPLEWNKSIIAKNGIQDVQNAGECVVVRGVRLVFTKVKSTERMLIPYLG